MDKTSQAGKKTGRRLAELDYSILQQCMHCGMCLPVCPTFAESGKERHSPRGRIALMRAIADGELEPGRAFAEELAYCLGCLACTSACPAGVDYGTMLETAKVQVEDARVLASPKRDFLRWFTMRFLFTRPKLLRFAGRLLWLYQASGGQRLFRALRLNKLLPAWLRESEPLTPDIRRRFSHELIAPVEAPKSTQFPRHRVLVLTGCMQDIMFSEINRATVDVLVENGCEVHTPPLQFCCGSLHAHNGDHETALLLAGRQLDAIDPFSFHAIISNAGGCGSHLRHYSKLLAGDPRYADKAAEWTRKVRDIHEWLVEINFRKPLARGDEKTCVLTYHESCHLCHGQKVSRQPREVLKAVPGVELRELAESNWCCGSAGIYNLVQPVTAGRLQERKLGHVAETNAEVVATANPGCHLQLENGMRVHGPEGVKVVHPVVLLADAYRREKSA